MKLPKYNLILLIILVLGLFLRIYDLGTESLWVDEAYSIRYATHLDFSHIAAEDKHPPLYYIIMHHWINVFGDSEFSTRLPSVIFGLFALVMIYKLGSLMFDKDVGMLSALILGLSRFHIFYSQDVRMYSLMVMLTLFSMYFFIKLFEKKSFMVSIGYILSSSLLMYTHYYGFFIIIGQNIYFGSMLLLSKKEYKLSFMRWVFLHLILIVLFIPGIGILVSQALKVQSDYWLPVPSVLRIAGSILRYSSSSELLVVLFLTLSALSLVTYEKIKGDINWRDFFHSIEDRCWNIRLSNVQGVYLLFVWFCSSVILPLVISRIATPIYNHRCTIAASSAFYLLIAKGIRNITSVRLKVSVISMVIVFSGVSLWGYYSETTRDQWREVAGYIDMNAEEEDLLLFNAGFPQVAFDYYSTKKDLIKKPFPKKDAIGHPSSYAVDRENIRLLFPIVNAHKRIWLILSYTAGGNKNLIINALNENYHLSYEEKYMNIDVYLFEKNEKTPFPK